MVLVVSPVTVAGPGKKEEVHTDRLRVRFRALARNLTTAALLVDDRLWKLPHDFLFVFYFPQRILKQNKVANSVMTLTRSSLSADPHAVNPSADGLNHNLVLLSRSEVIKCVGGCSRRLRAGCDQAASAIQNLHVVVVGYTQSFLPAHLEAAGAVDVLHMEF